MEWNNVFCNLYVFSCFNFIYEWIIVFHFMNIWRICLFHVANGGNSDKGVCFDNIFSQFWVLCFKVRFTKSKSLKFNNVCYGAQLCYNDTILGASCKIPNNYGCNHNQMSQWWQTTQRLQSFLWSFSLSHRKDFWNEIFLQYVIKNTYNFFNTSHFLY